MTDFFGGLHGAQFPQVVMNSGPLPPEGGLPAPLHDTADARINAASSLLGDMSPYAYGEPGYLSSQVSYVNKPHRIQKIVPMLALPTPEANSRSSFTLSHPVDDSDVTFVMRLSRKSTVCTALGNRSLERYGMDRAADAIINLPTLNYLLAGFQLFHTPNQVDGGGESLWGRLLHDLDQSRFRELDRPINLRDLHHIVRELITPFGVMRGSEKQGGQSEVTISAVQWPVDFVGNFVLDGHEQNVINYWHFHPVNAGDDLVFRLRPMPIPYEDGYTLNHYYKHIVRQPVPRFTGQGGMEMPYTHVWQLVPDVMGLDIARADVMTPPMRMPPGFEWTGKYVWQEHGYWHIGRSQVMFRKYGQALYYHNDMANMLKINHLDMTFEPLFLAAPLAGVHRGRGGRFPVAPPVRRLQGDADEALGRAPRPGYVLASSAQWTPQLRLEAGAAAPRASAPPRAAAPPSAPPRPQQSIPVPSWLMEAVGAPSHHQRLESAVQPPAERQRPDPVDAVGSPIPARSIRLASPSPTRGRPESTMRLASPAPPQPEEDSGTEFAGGVPHTVDASSMSLPEGLSFAPGDPPPAKKQAKKSSVSGVSFKTLSSSGAKASKTSKTPPSSAAP